MNTTRGLSCSQGASGADVAESQWLHVDFLLLFTVSDIVDDSDVNGLGFCNP